MISNIYIETIYWKSSSAFSTTHHCKLEHMRQTHVEKEAIRILLFICC